MVYEIDSAYLEGLMDTIKNCKELPPDYKDKDFFNHSGTTSGTLVSASDIIFPVSIPREHLDPATDLRVRTVADNLAALLCLGNIDVENLRGNVIDFGCGSGGSTHVLKQYGGNVIGLDLSSGMIKHAIEQGILTPETAFVCDGFKYLDEEVEPESIDLLTAFLIMHDFSIGKLYQSAQRVLKFGGQLIVSGLYDAQSLIEEHAYLGELQDKAPGDICLICTKSDTSPVVRPGSGSVISQGKVFKDTDFEGLSDKYRKLWIKKT